MFTEQKTDISIENMFSKYVYELSVNPSSASLFENQPSFVVYHNDMIKQRQIDCMIAIYGPCPCLGVPSTSNKLGHVDWGRQLAYNIQLTTPSDGTLFQQHVDALRQILKLPK
jgi:hypothetical protein